MLHAALTRWADVTTESYVSCSTQSYLDIDFVPDKGGDDFFTLASRCTLSHLPRSSLSSRDKPTKCFFYRRTDVKGHRRGLIPDHSGHQSEDTEESRDITSDSSWSLFLLWTWTAPKYVVVRTLWGSTRTSGTTRYSKTAFSVGPQVEVVIRPSAYPHLIDATARSARLPALSPTKGVELGPPGEAIKKKENECNS